MTFLLGGKYLSSNSQKKTIDHAHLLHLTGSMLEPKKVESLQRIIRKRAEWE